MGLLLDPVLHVVLQVMMDVKSAYCYGNLKPWLTSVETTLSIKLPNFPTRRGRFNEYLLFLKILKP